MYKYNVKLLRNPLCTINKNVNFQKPSHFFAVLLKLAYTYDVIFHIRDVFVFMYKRHDFEKFCCAVRFWNVERRS